VARSRIGPLALEAPLGPQGSSVYRAIHVQQRSQVAVRVFSMPMGMTPERKQEFAQSLERIKQLKHPELFDVMEVALMPKMRTSFTS
jgi:eukaryotic-like serine/threonine-protein kinase